MGCCSSKNEERKEERLESMKIAKKHANKSVVSESFISQSTTPPTPLEAEIEDGLSPIRLIDFADFKMRDSFPRYPDNKGITVTKDSLTAEERERCIIVFISHSWLLSLSDERYQIMLRL